MPALQLRSHALLTTDCCATRAAAWRSCSRWTAGSWSTGRRAQRFPVMWALQMCTACTQTFTTTLIGRSIVGRHQLRVLPPELTLAETWVWAKLTAT